MRRDLSDLVEFVFLGNGDFDTDPVMEIRALIARKTFSETVIEDIGTTMDMMFDNAVIDIDVGDERVWNN